MTTLGKTRTTPNISLRLASKYVKFHLQANMPPWLVRWLLVLLGAAFIWLIPSFNEYVNIVISLMSK